MAVVRNSFLLLTRCAKPTVFNKVTNTRTIARWVSPTLKELKRRKEKIGPEPEQPRSSFLEWNYEAELFAFGKRLGETFDKNILKKALTHREYANLQEFKAQESGTNLPAKLENNYELIQEGETLLSNYISTEYSKSLPKDVVVAILNYLTSEKMLAHIAEHIGLKDLILSNEFPVSEKVLSDTFKAIISALKFSQNQSKAEYFIRDFVITQMNGKEVSDIWEPKEPYEYLTKLLNQQGINNVEPRLCNESASNTILACYQVGIYHNKNLLGIGWGESIHIAKETAALNAIHKIFSNEVSEK